MSDADAMRSLCALLADPGAPYAWELGAEPGDRYESPGAPYPPLEVVASEVTPVERVVFQRQVVAVATRPGEPPVHVAVLRMVGELADGRTAPLGEVVAMPDAVLRAVESGAADRCAACGCRIAGNPVVIDGQLYCQGCVTL